MNPSDFTVVLDDNMCNIIYHNDTQSYNITYINNYMFSKSLSKYNKEMQKLNKKAKLKYKRPIKLKLDNNALLIHDMRKASSPLYRGFYMNNIGFIKLLFDEHYKEYDYSYNDFIKDIKKMYNLKLEEFRKYNNIQTIHLNKQSYDVIVKSSSILTKNNVLITKKFLNELYNTGYEYNRILKKFEKQCNVNVFNYVFNDDNLILYLNEINDIYLQLNKKKYDEDCELNVVLNEVQCMANKFHDVIINISKYNTLIGKLVSDFVKMKSNIYKCNHNCNDIDNFVNINNKKYNNLGSKLNILNNHINYFNPIIQSLYEIYKIQKDVNLEVQQYYSNFDNIIKSKCIMETFINDKFNIEFVKHTV